MHVYARRHIVDGIHICSYCKGVDAASRQNPILKIRKTIHISWSVARAKVSVVEIHRDIPQFRTLDIMSECDNPDEHCETSRVREEKAMGDVHEHTEDDTHRESPSPECPRQEADGAPESSGDEPSPIDTPSTDSVELQVRFSSFHRFIS